jgi:hypothetical protein
VGHLAWQEQRYWLFRGQGRVLAPEVQRVFANGAPYARVREAVLTVRNQVVSRTRGTNGDRSFSLLGWRQAP